MTKSLSLLLTVGVFGASACSGPVSDKSPPRVVVDSDAAANAVTNGVTADAGNDVRASDASDSVDVRIAPDVAPDAVIVPDQALPDMEPPVQSLVGEPCTANEQCDPGGFCSTQMWSGEPGGYCSTNCLSNGLCPVGSHCTSFGLCRIDCTSDDDCRAGYACYDRDLDGLDECYQSGTGTGLTGTACGSSLDCAGGHGTVCASPARGFDEGYCTGACQTAADCPGNSRCLSNGACAQACSSSTECRGPGYACYDTDGDGQNECWRYGTGDGELGDPCGATSDCATQEVGICLLQVSGFVGGYCSRHCSVDQHCFGTGVCITDAEPPVCLQSCGNNADCRTGYSCQTIGGKRGCAPAP